MNIDNVLTCYDETVDFKLHYLTGYFTYQCQDTKLFQTCQSWQLTICNSFNRIEYYYFVVTLLIGLLFRSIIRLSVGNNSSFFPTYPLITWS